MKNKINLIIKKCKSLSMQLGRSSSYSSLRSKSTREEIYWPADHAILREDGHRDENDQRETILVGSTRRRYMVRSKHLNHPLLNALIDDKYSKQNPGGLILIKCEVVLFDHLLWMIENSDPTLMTSESLEELAQLYTF